MSPEPINKDTVFDRFRLDGKVALITGAGPGIGGHVAQAFAAAGAKVVLCARSKDKVDSVADQISADGGEAIALAIDVSEQDQLDKLVDTATKAFGPVHILFNNAGRTSADVGLDPFSISDEEWQKSFEVNVLAPYRLARALVPGMKAAGYGSIINTTAVLGHSPKPHVGGIAYGTTKAALTMMTRYIAKECGPEVRANMICPGSVNPVGPAKMTPIQQLNLASISLGRMGYSDEAVGAALLLASPASSFTTGITIYVDGGRVSGAV